MTKKCPTHPNDHEEEAELPECESDDPRRLITAFVCSLFFYSYSSAGNLQVWSGPEKIVVVKQETGRVCKVSRLNTMYIVGDNDKKRKGWQQWQKIRLNRLLRRAFPTQKKPIDRQIEHAHCPCFRQLPLPMCILQRLVARLFLAMYLANWISSSSGFLSHAHRPHHSRQCLEEIVLCVVTLRFSLHARYFARNW